jgi:virulence factor Mce-like protein
VRIVKGNPIVAGLGLIAGCLVVLIAAISINVNFGFPANLNLGWPPGFDYALSAAFDDANGLAHGAEVVVAGTSVGQVTDVAPSGRQAVVTMRIDRTYAPMHTGTIARIRYGTLLAQKYVELTPVAGGASIPSGARIPSTSTVTPVDFDQFLSTLDPETRMRLQTIVQQAGGGVDGRQQAINSLLDNLGHLAVESRAGLSTFRHHDPDLGNVTTNLAITSNRLAQSHDNLGGFIANSADVNGTLAANDRSLSGLILHLANTMDDFNQTLNGEEGNFHDTVTTFDPFLVQLNGTLGYVYPYLHDNLGALTTGLTTLVPYIGSAIQEQDANGNYLRQYLVNDCKYDATSDDKGPASGCPSAPSQPASSSTAPPALPIPKPKATALCPSPLPKVTPPPLPTPIPTITNCPTPLPPCIPIPGIPTPTPIPTPSPGSCTPIPGGINPPGTPPLPPLPLPVPSLPSIVTGLAGGGL